MADNKITKNHLRKREIYNIKLCGVIHQQNDLKTKF